MNTARLGPEAEVELREAAAWYKERSPDAARRFLAEVRAMARAIARKPQRFPVLIEPELDPPVRRALLSSFPYALVFVIDGDIAHVIAVAHQHRAPRYWLYRIGQAR